MDEHVEAPAEHAAAEHEAYGPEPAPAPALVTLDDWCAAKSKAMRGHVELVSAFATLERRKHNLLALPETFEAAFEALRTRKAE